MERVHVLTGAEIAAQVTQRVLESVLADGRRGTLEEIVHETIYDEQARLDAADAADAETPRGRADRAHVAELRHTLVHAGTETGAVERLVAAIVARYVDEISGHFDPRVYATATRLLPTALGALFGGDVEERVVVEGEIEPLVALARIGTIVLAPTHVSNLDSVVLGYVIDRLGLPPFAYGAGLNLFSSAVVGFFMRNLGAYTVDRKKKDPLYKAALREYATVLLERGQHNLFFPGGTRSRSGRTEDHVKKGLLGTTAAAFRHAAAARASRARVFVVPCTLTYPLVLEAASLARDWLRAEGGPHFVDLADEFEHPRRWIAFVRGLAALDARVHVRVGGALDPVGNGVDREGTSHDPRGRAVDVAGYFREDGELEPDEARDAAYTRMLAARLVEAYRRDTVALPTSIVAHAVFARLRRERPQADLFRFMRSLGPDATLAMEDVRRDVARSLDELERLESRGTIRVAPELRGRDAGAVLDQAIAWLATYHAAPVLVRAGDGRLHVGDANLLLYYRNRLDGYGLGEAA